MAYLRYKAKKYSHGSPGSVLMRAIVSFFIITWATVEFPDDAIQELMRKEKKIQTFNNSMNETAN